MTSLIRNLRLRRAAHLAVVNLRILLGFAFLPAGIKKVLGQPFTDPANHGSFHDFLHAFRDTGGFYRFVGMVQLVAAVLLMTQWRATLGAVVALPIITAIVALCWSTGAVPTAVVATLMWLGTVALVLWDEPAWRAVLGVGERESSGRTTPSSSAPPLSDLRLWGRCGAAIFVTYVALTAMAGEVYRPRRVELDKPAFYLLVALPLLPLSTWLLERRRRKQLAG